MSAAVNQSPGNCQCGSTCLICVNVTNCAGTAISGATVTVYQSGSPVGTATTDGSGNACVDITATGSGSYHVDVSKTGYSTYSDNVTASCPGTTNLNAKIDSASTNQVIITVRGCGSQPIPGATVVINGGSYTTNSSGQVILSLPAGTYSYTASMSRFDPGTGSVTVVACSQRTSTVTLTPASGYHCPTGPCGTDPAPWQPYPDTLYLTDSVFGGPITLTYSAGPHWTGSAGVSFGGGCGCAAAGTTISYDVSSGCNLGVSYKCVSGSNFCPSGSGTGNQSVTAVFVSVSRNPLVITFTQTSGCTVGTKLYTGTVVWTISE